MSYKRYPRYKDSGVDWIGEVPEHWDVVPIKRLARVANGATPDSKTAGYWDGDVIWFTPADLDKENVTDLNHSARCLTRAGLESCATRLTPAGSVVLSTRAPVGSVGITTTQSATNQGCRTLIPFNGFPSKLLAEALVAARGELAMRANGTTFKELSTKSLEGVPLPAPANNERSAIVESINRETARIDALIVQKTRFIELLKEKRQALIAHVTTQGLDPNVKMKDSGVEWIGRVPAHWNTAQLGKVTLSRCDGPFGSGLKSEHYVAEGVRVVRLQNIGSDEFKGGDAAFISEDHWKNVLGAGHDVRAGDLLIAGLGDENNPLGRACVAPDDLGDAMVKADCYRFRLGPRLLPSYAARLLSATAKGECGYLATGATRDRLNLGLAASRVVLLPPPKEQQTIVDALDARLERIDTLSTKTLASIALLKERRAALITAAVTGQIDLREAA